MRKSIVILISILLIVGFLALVYYGMTHSRGIPVVPEEKERVILEIPFIDNDIDLKEGASLSLWDSISSKEIELMHQVMVLPWGKSLVSPISVKAFHNKEDIYFYISWKDDTRDSSAQINKFSDACAIMFPMEEETQPSTLMMGFLGKANMWHWKASQDREYWSKEILETKTYTDFYYPFEEEELFIVSKDIPKSAVNDLMAIRVGTITPKQMQNIHGRGLWHEGKWHVVFRRSFKPTDPEIDAGFNLGKKRLCAFAVWDGATGDRGGRKSISDWVELEVK